MNLNRQDTELLPETSQICLKCRKNFVLPICKKHLSEEQLEDAKNKFIANLYYFKDHSVDCPICIQFSSEDFIDGTTNYESTEEADDEDNVESDVSERSEIEEIIEHESTQESVPGPSVESGQNLDMVSDTESEGNEPLASFEIHIEALEQICSLCGTKVSNKKRT